MSGLLSPRFPVPSPAELRARIETRAIDQVMPGFWIDVHVLGGQDDQEGRQTAEEIRATIRKAVADTADKAACEKRNQPINQDLT